MYIANMGGEVADGGKEVDVRGEVWNGYASVEGGVDG